MLDNFTWQESEDGINHIEGESLLKEINECAELIFQDFLTQINLQHFSYEMIVVPIDIGKFPLLIKCFDKDTSDESKDIVVKSLQDIFFSLAWYGMSDVINKLKELQFEINDIFRIDLQQNVLLEDDDKSPKMQVEISLKS